MEQLWEVDSRNAKERADDPSGMKEGSHVIPEPPRCHHAHLCSTQVTLPSTLQCLAVLT